MYGSEALQERAAPPCYSGGVLQYGQTGLLASNACGGTPGNRGRAAHQFMGGCVEKRFAIRK